MDRDRIRRLEQELAALRAQVPVRTPRARRERDIWAQIIGGNPLASGIEAIQYAASVTPLAVYDPDVDTAYPNGLGNAWLFIDGKRQLDRVLVRHNFIGDQTPVLSGRPVQVFGSETLTFSGTDMIAYYIAWI